MLGAGNLCVHCDTLCNAFCFHKLFSPNALYIFLNFRGFYYFYYNGNSSRSYIVSLLPSL